MIRLNKYLSEAGICSRREADRLIEAGRVTVDGVQAVPGMKVSEEQKICVGKKVIQGAEQKVVLAVNKPAGIVCTGDMKVKNNIIQPAFCSASFDKASSRLSAATIASASR